MKYSGMNEITVKYSHDRRPHVEIIFILALKMGDTEKVMERVWAGWVHNSFTLLLWNIYYRLACAIVTHE